MTSPSSVLFRATSQVAVDDDAVERPEPREVVVDQVWPRGVSVRPLDFLAMGLTSVPRMVP